MPESPLAGLRILVVDDNPALRLGTLRSLRSGGACADGVASGEEATQLVVAGWSFDIMLVDLALPQMSGAECAHLVRSARRLVQGGTIDVILGMSRDPEHPVSQRVEFDGILAKPLSQEALLAELQRIGTRQDRASWRRSR